MSLSLLSTATRYFMEVARTGSVSEAAAQVHVAASAVSRQVAKLESSLGCALFDRQARGMVLTDAGERLAAYVRMAEQDTERVAQELRGLDGQRARRIHVACTEGFSADFMPGAMASFRTLQPSTSIFLRVGSPHDVSGWLLRGEVDIGLKFAVAPERGLKTEHQRAAPIMVLIAPGHALAGRQQLSVADIVQYPLALPSMGTTVRQAFDLCCSLHGLQYQAIYSGNYAVLLALAARGGVLTLSSYLSAAHLVADGALVAASVAEPVLEQRSMQILSLQGRFLASPVSDFVIHLAALADVGSSK